MKRNYHRYIVSYDFNGKLVRVYETAKEASQKLGLFDRTIDKAIRMNTTAGGYLWRRYNSEEDIKKTIEPYRKEKKSTISQPIIRIDSEGNEVEYKSIRFASLESNVSMKQIRECLLGHQSQAGGYKWKKSQN